MKEPPPSPSVPQKDKLTAAHATRLLQLGLNEPIRPIDQLLDRLSHSDGSDWLEAALSASPAAAVGPPRRCLAEGSATLGQLRSVKQQSKQLLSERKDAPSRLHATIGYFFSIGAALAHYGEVITNRSGEELLPVLRDLAAITPPPWSAMFSRAASSLPIDSA